AFQDLPQFSSHITKIDENCFDLEESTKTLLNHFQASTLEGYGCSRLPMAVKAAGAILHYIEKTQRNAMAQITRLTTYTTDSFMIIDQKSAHNLEIFENTSGNVKGSLLSVLDITRTPMGVRLLKKWLGQPLLDIKSIEQRQNGIGWFYSNSIHRADIIALLGRIGDIERMINRVSAGIAIPRELMSLKTGLEIVPRLKAILKENKFELIALADELKSCDEVVQLIIKAIVDNPSTTVGEGETIKRGFSRDLDDLISKSRNAKQYIADLEKSERQRSGIKSLKVGYNRVFGYYIEVTTPHLDKVPSDYIRKQTLSTGERYYTTQLKEFESIIINAESRIADLETDIYRQVCRQ
ncbi:MAG: DNA mismatch repair protein MutS, partial [Chloroflexi bacterium]|nr:DNA mismatch repair protein MutS [Chloroflexota bacterium]